MIENREIYSFEETEEPDLPEDLDAEIAFENDETSPPKFLYQSVVAIISLVLVITICRLEHEWAYWARKRLNYAINASSQATFGILWDLPFFQKIVRDGKNFIRLEKVTQTMSGPGLSFVGDSLVFEDSVWPVPGNIIKEYGDSGPKDPFDSGVIIETSAWARVIAVAPGVIARTNTITGGWEVEVDHGSGWSSVYQPLTQVQVHQGQRVKAGEIIGRLGFGNDGKSQLFLEISQNGRPVNPRTVIR